MKYKFKNKDEHIINIIDHLDMQKIHSVMEFLNGKWLNEPVSIGKIYSELMSRLNDVIKEFEDIEYDGVEEVYYGSETGGIRIGIRLDENNEPYLDVMFVLTQWQSFVEI